jgi:predicted phage terminase large subunit-like protein
VTTSPFSWIDDLETQLLEDLEQKRLDAGGDQIDRLERWATPGAMALELGHKVNQTPALDLIDQALVELVETPDARLIVTMPPQEGKSDRVARWFPTWLLHRNPETRIVNASYGQTLASRNGRFIRRLVEHHGEEFNLRLALDNGSVADWSLAEHGGGVFSVGIGGGVTGRAADLIIIDDPIKSRAEADSETYRERVWEWWTDEAAARLAPGAPVVLIQTRWHQDDLAGRLLASPDGDKWQVLNIPAEADHDPAKGETDPLGREPGQFMISARGRTEEQWQARKVAVGSRTWAAQYQGRPTEAKGNILRRDWWRRYEAPLWISDETGACYVTNFDQVLMSWDLAFEGKKTSDWVVGQVWARRGADAYLLDQVRGKWDFPQTLGEFTKLAAKWPQAIVKLVENKANGPALIASLSHKVPGIIPDEPHGSKTSRATAVAPFAEAGNVWLPTETLCEWVEDLIEEAAAFPTGKHDDQVDALSAALNRLLVQPLILDEELVTAEDLDDDVAGLRIVPY